MWQSVAIIAVAVLIGLGVNALRHERLSLIADWPSAAQRNSTPGGDDLVISLEDAQALHFDQEAVFLDARPKEHFRKGHIEGAKNLPWEDFDRRFPQVMSDISHDAIIIVYCDGESCSLSKELASALVAQGYDQVRVLVDGWGRWQQFNLPTER